MDARRHSVGDELFPEVNKHYNIGTDIQAGNDDDRLLANAVAEEDFEKVKHLATLGASVNITNSRGNTPLHVAVIKSNLEILDYLLLQDNININLQNISGQTPLLLAVMYRFTCAVKKFIEVGADVNIPDYGHFTPLHFAITYPDVLHMLIQHGACLDVVDSVTGDTPLHDAVTHECLETVCMLLYYNADANVRDANNFTPFMKALIFKNVEIQAALIDYVDDFNIETVDHIMLLALALRNNSPFVENIINGGADVNYACRYNRADNAFSICLQVPNPKNYRLVWNKLKFNVDDMPLGSILLRINQALRDKDYFEQYIDIIIESDNMFQVVDSITMARDFDLVIGRFGRFNHPLDQLTKLTCCLLTFGYVPTSLDVSKVFLHYGYCELFKILLHMDIKLVIGSLPDITRIIFDISTRPEVLFNQLITQGLYIYPIIYYKLLNYFIYPKLFSAYLALYRQDEITFKILCLPNVPSLLELSRNKTREFIRNKFRHSNSRQFYTLINYLNMSTVYKKILTFETMIYRLDAAR